MLDLANICGTSRLRQEGLSAAMADEIACRLGCHPVEIWPEWFDVALSDLCGTERGFRLHDKHGDDPCHLCDAAHAKYQSDRCGTPKGYELHRRSRTTPCPACRAANTAKSRRYYERQAVA